MFQFEPASLDARSTPVEIDHEFPGHSGALSAQNPRGRLRGNLIALADLMRGRLVPDRVLEL